ncbi:MAG TPA: sigma 54-interacting transcriptional regulator [Polyangia bacterium]|nr:sigma 54-interacting transcriptional regulator [Polyangia bacterium]
MRDPNPTILTPTEADDAGHRFIAARVLAHPDPARVGEFAPLFDANDGGTATLSRESPDFRTPAGARSGPLASARISRNQLLIQRLPGGLGLRYDAPSPGVEVNGRPLVKELTLSTDELQAGIAVLLGRDLALWIGWFEHIDTVAAVPGLIGEGTEMRRLRQQICILADLDVPVLLRGETGVGKELVAAAIHRHSKRSKGSYVAVNLAGVPPSMAASELFGHKRGAFTGATEERRGYFAQADGGTLFLDEIGDVGFDVQSLLLRAVQERVIQPVGGTTRQVDVRLIAATDSDLETAVARREFREPLLRRFSCELRVPTLRARREDVGLLFYHLLRGHLQKMGEEHRLERAGDGDEPFVPAPFVAALALHAWPGNVRELANVALKFAVENRGRARGRAGEELMRLITPRRADAGAAATTPAIPAPPRSPGTPAAATAPPAVKRAEELSDAELLEAFRAEAFSPERTARRLGLSKSYLYKRLRAHPEVARAHSIPAAEIRAVLRDCSGDVVTAAARLRISTRALRLQLRRLDPTSA